MDVVEQVKCHDCARTVPRSVQVYGITGHMMCPGCARHRDEETALLMASLGSMGSAAACGAWLGRLRRHAAPH